MTDASPLTLTATRIAAGVWEGVLSGVSGTLPVVEALHQESLLEGVEVTPLPRMTGQYAVKVPIPAAALNEGVQTFLLRAAGTVLAQFTVIAGVPLEEDLRAEISLLRAELDLLKRAFRRHCAETAQ